MSDRRTRKDARRAQHEPGAVKVACVACGKRQNNRHIDVTEATLGVVFFLGCIVCGHPYGTLS